MTRLSSLRNPASADGALVFTVAGGSVSSPGVCRWLELIQRAADLAVAVVDQLSDSCGRPPATAAE